MRLERTPDKREVGSSTLPRPTRVNAELLILNIEREGFWNSKFIIKNSQLTTGGVAQLGERLPCTQEVIGSIPFTSTKF